MIIIQNSDSPKSSTYLKIIPREFGGGETIDLTLTDNESKVPLTFTSSDFTMTVDADGLTTFAFATGIAGLVDNKTYDLVATASATGIVFKGQVYTATSADDTKIQSNKIRDSFTAANTTKNSTDNKYKVYE
jgi:hypothetical protein